MASRVKKEVLDPRYSIIKKLLYQHSVINVPIPKETITSDDPAISQKDVIERSWFHFQQSQALEIQSNLKRKYIRMRKAMLELEQHPTLFAHASQNPIWSQSPDLTLIPSRLRIPTDTPPKQ
jgi:hypothetical protein